MFEQLFSSQTFQLVVPWVLLVWGITWELFAMWKAAKKGHMIWFVLLFIVQLVGYLSIVFAIAGSFGLLPILYIFVFSRIGFKGNTLTFEKWKKGSPKLKKKS